MAGSNNKFNWVKLGQQRSYVLYQPKKSNVAVRVALFSSQPTAGSTGTLIATFQSTDQEIKLNFETTQTNIYVGWVYCNTSNLNGYTQQEMIDSIKLFKGEELTDYSDNPIELCEIGDCRDYPHQKEGEWHIHKEVGKVILDGTQNGIRTVIGTTGYYRFCPDIGTNIKTIADASIKGSFYSDKLTSINRNQSYAGTTGIAPTDPSFNYKSFIIFTEATKQMTYVEFQTWLSTHNITIYYQYETPQEIPITNQTLINQLNALKNDGQSYYDITNINVITQNAQPTIEAEAFEKI